MFIRTLTSTTNGATIPVDAVRNDDRLHLDFDLPGFRAEDIDLTFERGVLRLTAERNGTEPAEGDTVLRRERRTGTATRWLRLGDRYDGDAIDASFQDGVLHVTLPVKQTDQPRRIEIAA